MGAYHDDPFPTNLNYGTKGGPSTSTSIIETGSGAEERVARWTGARHRYDVGYAIKTYDDLSAVKKHYLARNGPAVAFPLKDLVDFTSASNGRDAHTKDDVLIGTGDGTTTVFQLKKLYTSGPSTHTRLIKKPKSGTVLIAFDGVNQSSGWTVDYQTGEVTFSVAPTLGVLITAGFEFWVPVRHELDEEGLLIQLSHVTSGGIPSIPLIEDVDTSQVNEDYYPGESTTQAFSSDIQLSQVAVQWVLQPTAGSLKAKLPLETNWPLGPNQFVLVNTTANAVSIVKYDGATAVCTLPAQSGSVPGFAYIGLMTIAGVPTWYGV